MTSLRELTPAEKDAILTYFASTKYMVGLSRGDFDVLSAGAIGRALCRTYDVPVVDAFRRYVLEEGHPAQTLELISCCMGVWRKKHAKRLMDDSSFQSGFLECEKIVSAAIGTGRVVVPQSSQIDDVEVVHIKRALEFALDDARRGRFENAFTGARAAVESSLKHVLKKAGKEVPATVELTALWGDFKRMVAMPYGRGLSNQQNDLVAGLGKVLVSINEARNALGSAHGKAESPVPVGEVNVRLFVNAATTFCDYVLSVANAGEVKCL